MQAASQTPQRFEAARGTWARVITRAGATRAHRALASAAATAIVLALALVGCSGVGTAPAPPKFSVTTTLHGLSKLPHRIHWQATPSVSASDVKEVAFLIDDQLAWLEHYPPYFYADDRNWLVTSFLEPGAHTFVTKATTLDGRIAVETVTATVEAAPQPPADLAGRWSKTYSGYDPGVWHVTINTIGWLFDDPHGGGQNHHVLRDVRRGRRASCFSSS